MADAAGASGAGCGLTERRARGTRLTFVSEPGSLASTMPLQEVVARVHDAVPQAKVRRPSTVLSKAVERAEHEVGGPSTRNPIVVEGSDAQSQDGRRLAGSQELEKSAASRGPGLGLGVRLLHRKCDEV